MKLPNQKGLLGSNRVDITFDLAPAIKDNIIKKEMKNRERIRVDSTVDKD